MRHRKKKKTRTAAKKKDDCIAKCSKEEGRLHALQQKEEEIQAVLQLSEMEEKRRNAEMQQWFDILNGNLNGREVKNVPAVNNCLFEALVVVLKERGGNTHHSDAAAMRKMVTENMVKRKTGL